MKKKPIDVFIFEVGNNSSDLSAYITNAVPSTSLLYTVSFIVTF